MSKMEKWNQARKTHEDLVSRARGWCHPSSGDLGVLGYSNSHGGDLCGPIIDWIANRKAELYRDLIDFSRARLAAAAREAPAECEQVLADAAMDVESTETRPMSAIEKWHQARKAHRQMVEMAPDWCDGHAGGPLAISQSTDMDVVAAAAEWVRDRRAALYRDMIALSALRVREAAREALAECEQVRADAAMDVGSIDEAAP
jgi:hypothetical protein